MASMTVAAADDAFSLAPATGRFDIHSLDHNASTVPLVAVNLSASLDTMKGRSLELGATYRAVGFDSIRHQLGYREIAAEFSVQAPVIGSMDFARAIREEGDNSPQRLLDKLIIDGAVGLNYSW